MRIAYLLNTLATGGAERLTVALADRMIARGHAAEIFVLREPAAGEFSTSVPVHYLGIRRNPASLPCAFFRVFHDLRKFRPDVIHGNNFHGNMLARALHIVFPDVRVISTIHNVYEGGPMRRLTLRLSDWLSNYTAAVSEAAAQEAIRRGVVPASKCSVVANGIDCAESSPDPGRRSSERARAGLGEEFVWLSVGRLVPAKDYPNLLRAFAQVHSVVPDALLWIVGEGKQRYAEHLGNLASSLQIDSSVRWLGLQKNVPALFDLADGFVLSSAWEGMPLALAEAMAMEKPFAATDVGGVRDLAGECGEIVPAHNPDALAAAMLKRMREPQELRRSLGRAAREHILARFTIEASASRWEVLYLGILAAREIETSVT